MITFTAYKHNKCPECIGTGSKTMWAENGENRYFNHGRFCRTCDGSGKRFQNLSFKEKSHEKGNRD